MKRAIIISICALILVTSALAETGLERIHSDFAVAYNEAAIEFGTEFMLGVESRWKYTDELSYIVCGAKKAFSVCLSNDGTNVMVMADKDCDGMEFMRVICCSVKAFTGETPDAEFMGNILYSYIHMGKTSPSDTFFFGTSAYVLFIPEDNPDIIGFMALKVG